MSSEPSSMPGVALGGVQVTDPGRVEDRPLPSSMEASPPPWKPHSSSRVLRLLGVFSPAAGMAGGRLVWSRLVMEK